jgi:hypothetical protein
MYQDVLNWATEANKQLHYDFYPQFTTYHAQIKYIGHAQIKYIEKLAQLQYCCSEFIQLTLPGNGKVMSVRYKVSVQHHVVFSLE